MLIVFQVLYAIGTSLVSVCMTHGGARHLYYLTPEERTVALKYNFLSQPIGAMAPVFGKISVGLLMLRIMGPNTVWRKWFVYGNLAIYMAISFLMVITTFVQCSPSRALWEMVPVSSCWNPNISVDLTILQSDEKAMSRRERSRTDTHISLWYIYGFCACATPDNNNPGTENEP